MRIEMTVASWSRTLKRRDSRARPLRKKIAWLKAAVDLAIKEGRLKFNPFSSVVPKRDDKLVRLPLDESDMKAIKSGLDRLNASARLLLRVLATTGCACQRHSRLIARRRRRGLGT